MHYCHHACLIPDSVLSAHTIIIHFPGLGLSCTCSWRRLVHYGQCLCGKQQRNLSFVQIIFLHDSLVYKSEVHMVFFQQEGFEILRARDAEKIMEFWVERLLGCSKMPRCSRRSVANIPREIHVASFWIRAFHLYCVMLLVRSKATSRNWFM